MKSLLILPLVLAGLAACSGNSDPQDVSRQTNACPNLSGAALLECQQQVQPTSQGSTSTFKMARPKPVNGNFRGGNSGAPGGFK
jgi:hypothetical protein